jgi:hypothetical protein
MAPRPRSKPAPAHVQPAPLEEEMIDIDRVSDTSEDDDTPPRAKAKTACATAANAPGKETTHVAPIVAKPAAKSNRALDIDLMFDRGKGKPSVCKYCK